jgi:hypothetical protein
MGHHSIRRLYVLVSCIIFVIFVMILNHSNRDPVWDTPTYFESLFKQAHLYPPKSAPHRILQFGLLETVSTRHPGHFEWSLR